MNVLVVYTDIVLMLIKLLQYNNTSHAAMFDLQVIITQVDHLWRRRRNKLGLNSQRGNISSRLSSNSEALLQNYWKIFKKCFIGIKYILISITCSNIQSHSIAVRF